MKVYIAGPMRGQPSRGWDNFFAAEVVVAKMGWTPLNPARIDSAFGTRSDSDDFSMGSQKVAIRRDLNCLIDEADAILLLPGWDESKGACAELALAEFLDLQVMELIDDE